MTEINKQKHDAIFDYVAKELWLEYRDGTIPRQWFVECYEASPRMQRDMPFSEFFDGVIARVKELDPKWSDLEDQLCGDFVFSSSEQIQPPKP